MSKCMVTWTHPESGDTFWLGTTVWRFAKERGTVFDDEAAARAGLLKAKPFMRASVYKAAKLEAVE